MKNFKKLPQSMRDRINNNRTSTSIHTSHGLIVISYNDNAKNIIEIYNLKTKQYKILYK